MIIIIITSTKKMHIGIMIQQCFRSNSTKITKLTSHIRNPSFGQTPIRVRRRVPQHLLQIIPDLILRNLIIHRQVLARLHIRLLTQLAGRARYNFSQDPDQLAHLVHGPPFGSVLFALLLLHSFPGGWIRNTLQLGLMRG